MRRAGDSPTCWVPTFFVELESDLGSGIDKDGRREEEDEIR
jgi:hypothetical protein